MPALKGQSHNAATPGVEGENTAGGAGIAGVGRRGVMGTSTEFQGVYGWGDGINVTGVTGESTKFHGVYGVGHDVNNSGGFSARTMQGAPVSTVLGVRV
jgi:hypothetical protein